MPEPLRRYLDRLDDQGKMLIVLKRELYNGDWRPMVTDLHNRLEGKPYIFKLAARIEDDLRRIEQMRELEQHYQVDLANYLQPLNETETGS
ncbi:MAG: hypothetical protein GC159_10105 [Phycisphaera sp.]|nr:hypothetical protein [Phycisphaera sp.]